MIEAQQCSPAVLPLSSMIFFTPASLSTKLFKSLFSSRPSSSLCTTNLESSFKNSQQLKGNLSADMHSCSACRFGSLLNQLLAQHLCSQLQHGCKGCSLFTTAAWIVQWGGSWVPADVDASSCMQVIQACSLQTSHEQ